MEPGTAANDGQKTQSRPRQEPSVARPSHVGARSRQEHDPEDDVGHASQPESPDEPFKTVRGQRTIDSGGLGVEAALEMGIEPPIEDARQSLDTHASSPKDEVSSLGAGSAESEQPEGFERSTDPADMRKNRNAVVEKVGETAESYRMHKFSLYETSTRYFVIGGDVEDKQFRMLKIDRTVAPGHLSITEDEIIYTKKEMNQLLNAIDDGNRAAGGMKLRTNIWGLLGFIRFTEAYYMLVVTKKQQVATIGGHYIYQVDDTEMIPLTTGSSSSFRSNRNPEETRFLAILNNLDLHRSFYFSYSYNVTRTLQHNVIKRRESLAEGSLPHAIHDYNDMFVWNQHLLDPILPVLKNPFDWCVPIMHGFVDQSSVSVFGREIYITLLARRSRFFAGARFLKRGANDLGYVANDVETEQIVADMLVTSFNTPRLQRLKNPNYTSFVQHRGSIPLYWTQDNSGVSPKPDINLNLIDPFYSTAALHFDHLFERYRAPVYVLNLVKARERTPRESKLLVEYQNAINFLNQTLPPDKKIKYRAYDMSRAAKTRDQDVIGALEEIADDIVRTTGFFQNDGDPVDGRACVQNGVVRSNCIDCLDRTNAAQFVIGKRALAVQLRALGIVTNAALNYDSDASNLFAHMFNDQGDTLASQYGGSHLVNTTDSYRKINNWQSHSRDMLESFKRYYHNSFLDNQRQEAYNLFLGNYIYAQGQPMLWDLPNDYYLHHTVPGKARAARRDYIDWYTPSYLEPTQLPSVPPVDPGARQALVKDWWHEYYRPMTLSSFARMFAYRMNSTTRYLPKPSARSSEFDMSPFCVRKSSVGDGQEPHHTRSNRHDVVIADSDSREILSPLNAASSPRDASKRISSLQKWLHPTSPKDDEDGLRDGEDGSAAGLKDSDRRPHAIRATSAPAHAMLALTASATTPFVPSDKMLRAQWTLAQFHSNSLHPSVTQNEAAEYDRYLTHPEHLARVVGEGSRGDGVLDGNAVEFSHYINSGVTLEGIPTDGQTTRGRELRRVSETEASRLEAELEAWLNGVPPEPLKVKAEDGERKRYKAYEKWLRGKSLFKQSKVDPEYRAGAG